MDQLVAENATSRNSRQAGDKLAKAAQPVTLSKESELQTEQVRLNLSQNVKPQAEQEPDP